MTISRRNFLKTGCTALSTVAALSGIEHLGLIDAKAQTADYRALVCVFLFGGNDSNNTLIPYSEYSDYSAVRYDASTINIPQENLLQITPPSDGRTFGLHPSMAAMHQLWNDNKMAILCNVGTLFTPLTKNQYAQNPNLRPSQLFSHSDQQTQWQTAIVRGQSQTGWGGRIGDKLPDGNAKLPMCISVNGGNMLETGRNSSPLVIAPHPTALNAALRLNGFDTSAASVARLGALTKLLDMDEGSILVNRASGATKQALSIRDSLTSNPTFSNFPNTSLGNQLYQCAKLISLRETLGMRRQIFFCGLGGFDTHNGQLTPHANLLTQVSNAIKAFYEVTVQMGVASQVTTFTLSDFSRTFHPSANAGSDHGWGGHHFIVGGAVKGGDFYGMPNDEGSVYPILARGGPDDVDNGPNGRGRILARTSVDQYAATLARWFGVSDSNLAAIFPNLHRFATSDLGFMNG
jgi:uncharacterized protein (DUF1501 family)